VPRNPGALVKQAVEIQETLGVTVGGVRVLRHYLVAQDRGSGVGATGPKKTCGQRKTCGKAPCEEGDRGHRISHYRTARLSGGARLEGVVISGAHVIVYSKDAEADRVFFRDVLGFASVDAGHGWLIFALPPAEVAFHPVEDNERSELYFMCEDLEAEIMALAKKNVRCAAIQEARWGSITRIRLPGGGEVGLYQPKHPTALNLR
jgi:hypothetical protein